MEAGAAVTTPVKMSSAPVDLRSASNVCSDSSAPAPALSAASVVAITSGETPRSAPFPVSSADSIWVTALESHAVSGDAGDCWKESTAMARRRSGAAVVAPLPRSARPSTSTSMSPARRTSAAAPSSARRRGEVCDFRKGVSAAAALGGRASGFSWRSASRVCAQGSGRSARWVRAATLGRSLRAAGVSGRGGRVPVTISKPTTPSA